MSILRHSCPSCAAPVEAAASATNLKCPYCGSRLQIERAGVQAGPELAISIASAGERTQAAIQASATATQSELRRMQQTQEYSHLQMRLSSTQSEIRALQRSPDGPVARRQLNELRVDERRIGAEMTALHAILFPSLVESPAPNIQKRMPRGISNSPVMEKLTWLLFSPVGRATRGDTWLGWVVFGVMALVLLPMAATAEVSLLGIVARLTVLWVYSAIALKRYHDRGKSGWWLFIALIPLGILWQWFELGLLPGNRGPNQYGDRRN